MDITQKILSDIIHHMKYARFLPEELRRETFEETITRNMEMHIKKFPDLEEEIKEAYKFVFEKKVLPSMRSVQFAGKAIETNPARLYNCCALAIDDIRAFSEIMFLLLSGCGVGYSVQKHHIESLPEIRKPKQNRTRRFLIGDSIEGWADSIKVLVRSYFEGTSSIIFDYSDIRPKGTRLKTSGGKAPGPRPLRECLNKIQAALDEKKDGDKLSPLEVHDIICYIADAVLAGGVRRSALICLFSADDEEMISCKSGSWFELNPQRARANNSAVIVRHRITKDVFDSMWEKIKNSNSGEPGIFFTNDRDYLTNPCVEASLRPNSFCNLTEINASNIENQEDFNKRAKVASFIGTLQASYTDFHYLRDVWKRTTEKDALLGISMTGIASNKIFNLDIEQAVSVAIEENKRVAKILGINCAARVTTVKPSGTSSLVLGTSSGIHPWYSEYYVRRIRVGKNEAIYLYLKENYPELLEDDYFNPRDMAIICIPQKAPLNAATRTESALEMLERVKTVHQRWINPGHVRGPNTHNVSATIYIRSNEWETVREWMWQNRNYYSGLSVLPYDGGTYIQMPFTECNKDEFDVLFEKLKDIDLSCVFEYDDDTNLKEQAACGGQGCSIV